MGSLFRSEPMTLCQLFVQSESAYDFVNLIGELGIAEFRDLNDGVNSFQRKFVNELRRCDEMERKLDLFEREIKKDDLPILECEEEIAAPPIKEISKIETRLEELERQIVAVNATSSDLKKTYLNFIEMRYVLKNTQELFESVSNVQDPDQNIVRRLSAVNIDPSHLRRFSVDVRGQLTAGLGGNLSAASSLTNINIPLDPVVDINFIAGTILREKVVPFERMVFRVSHGIAFVRAIDIDEPLEDPTTGELMLKSIIIIVVQGDRLLTRVKKICEGFRMTLYPCPETPSERTKMLAEVVSRIVDQEKVMKETNEQRQRYLVTAAKNLTNWRITNIKMKSIFGHLNMFSVDVTAKCLIAECWAANKDTTKIQHALEEAQRRSGSLIPSILTHLATDETPPTYFKTNKVTRGFQNIVDAYGVASYGEVNPAPFTVITFPFIFAVMFGDAGHGTVLTAFALWMVLFEKRFIAQKSRNEIWLMFFNGRYTILFMGLFSIYTGMIYNDIFSKSANIFGFGWEPVPGVPDGDPSKEIIFPDSKMQLSPNHTYKGFYGGAYPFGLNPIWQVSGNKITFLNSFKMKWSVIIGVIQMFFGVILSLYNHFHFKNWDRVLLEFFPQVIFMMAIFGYMNFMIFYKWFAYDWSTSHLAPSVLITLINMFLQKQPADSDPEYLKIPMFELQKTLHPILVILAIPVAIPWMLLIRPFYLNWKQKRQNRFQPSPGQNQIMEISAPIVSNEEIQHGVTTYRQASDIEMDMVNGSSAVTVQVNGEKDLEKPGHSSGGGQGSHGKHEEHSFGDIFIHQTIHTIEYCLGLISHTASYLRLWALSLAHAELSEVLWNMVMRNGFMDFHAGTQWNYKHLIGAIVMYVVFAVWAFLTFAILLFMEGLSAFLHALRLHWVEFQSKFYEGDGHAFQPFSFEIIVNQALYGTD